MPKFYYRACDHQGRMTEGKELAETREQLLLRLSGKHLHAVQILSEAEQERKAGVEEWIFRKMPVARQQIAALFEQLSLLLGSDISIVDALQAQEEQTRDIRIQEILYRLREKVEEGIPLHAAMQEQPKVFEESSIRIIEAGEQAGQLHKALGKLAEMIEFDIQVRQRFRETTRYPKIVLLTLSCAVLFLVSFVIPKFSELFRNSNVDLPLFTQILLGGYQGLKSYWSLVVSGILFISVCGLLLKKNVYAMQTIERWKLKFPVAGDLPFKIEMSRVFRILAILIDSGVDILNALQLAARISQNTILSSTMMDIRQRLESGQSMSSALESSMDLPPMARRMILLGEKSGDMSRALIRLSEIYEKQTRRSIGAISGMLEPVLIILIGLIVLTVALGIFLPMWDMIKVVK